MSASGILRNAPSQAVKYPPPPPKTVKYPPPPPKVKPHKAVSELHADLHTPYQLNHLSI
jgi:hypothetical protein